MLRTHHDKFDNSIIRKNNLILSIDNASEAQAVSYPSNLKSLNNVKSLKSIKSLKSLKSMKAMKANHIIINSDSKGNSKESNKSYEIKNSTNARNSIYSYKTINNICLVKLNKRSPFYSKTKHKVDANIVENRKQINRFQTVRDMIPLNKLFSSPRSLKSLILIEKLHNLNIKKEIEMWNPGSTFHLSQKNIISQNIKNTMKNNETENVMRIKIPKIATIKSKEINLKEPNHLSHLKKSKFVSKDSKISSYHVFVQGGKCLNERNQLISTINKTEDKEVATTFDQIQANKEEIRAKAARNLIYKMRSIGELHSMSWLKLGFQKPSLISNRIVNPMN